MSTTTAACTVYFDGACPLCRREITHYRSQGGAEAVAWVDVAACDLAVLGGLSRDAALARLHVRQADGSLVSGAAVFVAIWKRLPAYGWLAGIAARGPMLKIMDAAYSGFLHLRPLWRRANRSAHPLTATLPQSVLADLRTDHASAVGAVQIYRGILAVARDGELRAFAARHLATAHLHLRRIRLWLPASSRSRLLPMWRAAGWLTGAVAALLGPRMVFATVAAVERFADRHYVDQIERLMPHPQLAALRAALAACRRDEIDHRDDAFARRDVQPGWFTRGWAALIGKGSEVAVAMSRRL